MAKRNMLFKKPVGGSERVWNNQSMGTIAEFTCEACGTTHPELLASDSSRIIDRLLGLEIVEECCGKAIDVLYQEFGEEFCLAFLKDFANNPTDSRFGFLTFIIGDIVEEARKNCNKAEKAIDLLEKIAP